MVTSRRAGEIAGEILVELVYYSIILGTGIISIKLLSKVMKVLIAKEAIRKIAGKQNENHYDPDSDFE